MTEETTDKPEKKKVSRRAAARLMQDAFVRNLTTPTSTTYLNGTKSAEAAGYSKATAASQASRLMKRPRIKELIDAAHAKVVAELTGGRPIDAALIEKMHMEGIARCRVAGDRTNEREYIAALGRHIGFYDQSMHLDVTVRQEYDERLAIEASRVARVLLEEAGAAGLGALPAGDKPPLCSMDAETGIVTVVPEPKVPTPIDSQRKRVSDAEDQA